MPDFKHTNDAVEAFNILYNVKYNKHDKLKDMFIASLSAAQKKVFNELKGLSEEIKQLRVINNAIKGIPNKY